MPICLASSPEQIAAIRALLQEYAAGLGVDLCFQGFAQELGTLPGAYAPPRGCLLLATETEGPAGCVALRPLGETVCEMKRLFVRPAWRRQALGRALAQQIISEAKALGYASMVLDTLSSMKPALCLYKSLGFVPRSAYYSTPLAETVFLELQL